MKMAYPYEHPVSVRELPSIVNGTAPVLMPLRSSGQNSNDALEYKHNPYPKGEEPKSQNFPYPTLDKNGLIEPFYCGYAIEKTTPSPTGSKPSWAYQTYRRKRFESSAFRADAIKRARKLGNGVVQYNKVHSKYQKHVDRLLKDLNTAESDKRLEWVIASINPTSGPNKKLDYDEVHVIVKRVGRPLGAQTPNNKATSGKMNNPGRNDAHPQISPDEDQLRALERERAQQAHELRIRQAAAKQVQAQGYPHGHSQDRPQGHTQAHPTHPQAPLEPSKHGPHQQGEELSGFQRDQGKPHSGERISMQFQNQGIPSQPQPQWGGNQGRPRPKPDHPGQGVHGMFNEQGEIGSHLEQRPPPPPLHPGPTQYHGRANAQFEQSNARVQVPQVQPRPDLRAQFQGQAGQFGPPPPPIHASQQPFNAHQSRPTGNPNVSVIQDDLPSKHRQHGSKPHRPAPIKTQSFEAHYDRHHFPESKTQPMSPRATMRMQKEHERVRRQINRDFVDYSSSEAEYSDGGTSTVFTEAASDNDTIITTSASDRSQYKERSFPQYRADSSSSKGKKGKQAARRPTTHRRSSSPPRPTRHHSVRRNSDRSDRRMSSSPDHSRRNSERLPPIAEQQIRNLEEQVRDMKFKQDRLNEEMIRKDEREKQHERLVRERDNKADSYGIAGGRFDYAYDRQLRGPGSTYRRGERGYDY